LHFQAVVRMCSGGFCFDRSLCSSLMKKLRERMEQLEAKCFELANRQFNLDSSMQVSEVLFSRLKLSYPGGSSTKRHLSTNKAILEQMQTQHPIVAKILSYRRFKHALSQCLVPMERFVDDDGMVRSHCDMNTSTGRILSVEPNVQTVPKDDLVDGMGLRHLFRAQPGCVLISADYSQLELRVLAHLSSDPALIEILRDGQDVFADMSARLDISRDTTKKLCYGVIYGMGAKTLAETVKKSAAEADELIKNFFKSFPKVRTYINKTKEQGVREGFVATALGRRRVTCNARGRQQDVARDDRQSINYTIQGTASEIFKRAIVVLDEVRLGAARIVMTVHDEIIVQCAQEVEEEMKRRIRFEMERVFPEFRVPLPVKIRSGPNWGSLS
uniref:POLAc domain-containing protein n=1 Tax=Heligmosomoides polygyrus TaxID=6339 RepID=A0A183FGQ9_HELPZ